MTPKIAFITNQCDHFNLKLFELLSQKYEIHFYFTRGGESYRLKENPAYIGNFKVCNLKSYHLFGKFDFVPGLFKLLFRKYDIFIKTIDGRFSLPLIFFISRIKRVPFIFWTGLWQHPKTFFHKISFGITKYMYKTCEANLVYGEHIKKYLVSLGVNQDKIFCEHHAVDNDFFGKLIGADEKKILKDKLGISSEKIILYVGRLEYCKGLDYLIEAVHKIKHISCALVFVGTGELKEYLQEKCKTLRIKAIFEGYVPNSQLPFYYSIADVFVLPSITTHDFKEPWGFVINEAMNQGIPVIATEAIGAAMGGLVINGENGYIVSEKDSQALSEALNKVLTSEILKLKMGQSAKKRVLLWNYLQAVQDFSDSVDYVLKKR